MSGVGRDVGVHLRIAPLADPARPLLVVAPWVERIARVVEVVLETTDQILCGGTDLHEIGGLPGPAEGDRVLAEQQVDVHRPVRLARPALLELLHESDDRGEALGERRLVGQVGARDRGEEEREGGSQDEWKEANGTAHGWGFDVKRPNSGFGARVTLAALATGGFGGALFLIALGAIFRYAVTWEPAGVDIGTVGLILMIVGVVLFPAHALLHSLGETAERDDAPLTSSPIRGGSILLF